MCENKLTVLIIDNSEVIQERLGAMILEIKGVQKLLIAGSAMEGIKLAKNDKPEFIILDINLPDMNGMEALKEIKKDCPAACVAVLTNYPYPSYRTRCMDLGADYFFDKSAEYMKTKEILMELLCETCK